MHILCIGHLGRQDCFLQGALIWDVYTAVCLHYRPCAGDPSAAEQGRGQDALPILLSGPGNALPTPCIMERHGLCSLILQPVLFTAHSGSCRAGSLSERLSCFMCVAVPGRREHADRAHKSALEGSQEGCGSSVQRGQHEVNPYIHLNAPPQLYTPSNVFPTSPCLAMAVCRQY